MNEANNIQAAIQAGRDQITTIDVLNHEKYIVHPEKTQVTKLALKKLDQPRFLTAMPTFHDAGAFVAYVNAFKKAGTRIFYTQDGRFVAVLDYHMPAEASHGDHVAILIMKRSPEWNLWAQRSTQNMTQLEFAEFLEDNSLDILDPDPAVMLEVATGLQATVGATFRRAINQANGQINVQWDENVDAKVAGGTKDIPQTFTIGLRPFMGCSRYQVECRLRYRIPNGNLTFHYKTLRMDQVTEDAMEAVVLKIKDETQIAPALGAHSAEAFAKGQ